MQVLLGSRAALKKGQDPERRLPGVAPRIVEVGDLAEASKVALEFINEHAIERSDWLKPMVLDGGQEVARIGHDGTVWPAGRPRPGVEPLYEPKMDPRPDPNPHEYESAEIDLGEGMRMSVRGGLRIASWKIIGETRNVDPDLLQGRIEFSVDADPKVRRTKQSPRADALYERFEGALASWYAEPQAKAIVLGNEVRDRRVALKHAERDVDAAEDVVDQLREVRWAARDSLAEVEEMLADIDLPTPRP